MRTALSGLTILLALATLAQARADTPPAPAPAPAPAANAPGAAAPAASAAGAATASPGATDGGGAKNALPLLTKCVGIADASIFSSSDAPDAPASGPTTTATESSTVDCASLGLTGGTLTGIGQVQLAVDSAAFKQAREKSRATAGAFTLFLNGVGLRKDAELLATEEIGNLTVFRYRLRQGEETQRLWSMVYADSKWRTPGELHAAIAWTPQTLAADWELPLRAGPGASVQITTDTQLWIAALLVLITVAVVWYLGGYTSVLRDNESPAWLLEAKALQRRLKPLNQVDRATLLATRNYQVQQHASYVQAAEDFLADKPLVDGQHNDALLGLALHKDDWTPFASFSLSRTQLALWFTFTIASALFLWLIYGDLRRIDGSLLVLLGISGATGVVSWVSDRGAGGRPYSRSKGFWADLLTGFDEQKQLHRYQAVVVNLLLAVIGIFHVIQQLTYPVFDPTWLALLGISDALYGGGKQTLEQP